MERTGEGRTGEERRGEERATDGETNKQKEAGRGTGKETVKEREVVPRTVKDANEAHRHSFNVWWLRYRVFPWSDSQGPPKGGKQKDILFTLAASSQPSDR